MNRVEAPIQNDTLVEVRDLVKHFPIPRGGRLWREQQVVHAVNGVNLDIKKGEFLALVGESGSGKTTLANCIAGFLEPTSGSISLDRFPMFSTRQRPNGLKVRRNLSHKRLARRTQMIFQDPSSALNPRQTAGATLMEPITVHRLMGKKAAEARVDELLEITGLTRAMRRRYPHEMNAGQRQRVVIARALTMEPELLLADEAVSRLDVSMQSQILNLLLELHRELGLTIVFITHDLSVVRQVAERVAVMYLGRIMEVCSADAFFQHPAHPYSRALVASTPRFNEEGRPFTLEGEIPDPITPPSGCPFVTRCPEAIGECGYVVPALKEVTPGQIAACIRR